MRYIKRGNEPSSLAKHRAAIPGPVTSAHYDNLPKGIRPEMETQLRREQGELCGYCMSRLENKADLVRIDHWAPRETNPTLSLTWSNFVLACRGGERKGGAYPEPELPAYAGEYHCDKSKGEKAIALNPMNPAIESQVRYSATGRVGRPGSKPEERDPDLDDTLHLNASHLMRNRRSVIDALQRWMTEQNPSPAKLLAKALEWEKPDGEGRLEPYCGVATWHFRRWIRARGGT